MSITILNEKEIRSCVQMDLDSLQAVEEAFAGLSTGRAVVPPIMRIDTEEYKGEVDIKSAYVQGLDSFAVKIAAGFTENYKLGLPTGSGMMVLVNARTGFPQAVLLDNGYLTDVRTGLAGALAAKYLAPAEVNTAGVIGSGMQSRYQMRALKLVRDFQKLVVYGIMPDEVQKFAAEMEKELQVEVKIAANHEEVVCDSQVLVTTTPARSPFVRSDWLHPGLHITCMGSDAEGKQEIFADVFVKVDRVFCDRKSQSFRLGELQHAVSEGFMDENSPVYELGQAAAGMVPGRENEEQITICDLTGVGVQDTAIARLAYQRAEVLDLGLKIGN